MSQQINLFNPIFRRQKKYFSAVTMVQALALILFGAVLLSAYGVFRSTRLGADAMTVSMQLKSVQDQMAQVDATFPVREKSKALEEQIRAMEAEMASLRKVGDILQEGRFGNTGGHAEYLRAFARQIVDGVWLTGFSIHGAGAEIVLQGRTLQPELVPAYISRLKREPILQGKSFAALQMQAPQQKRAAAAEGGAPPAAAPAPAYLEFSLQSTDSAVPLVSRGGVVQQ